MKVLTLLLWMLPFSLAASSGNFYAYSIHPDSKITIQGTTNVNNFACVSESELPQGMFLAETSAADNSIQFSDAVLKLKVESFDCLNRRMNRDMQDAMGAETHPNILIRLLEAEPVDKSLSGGSTQLLVKLSISLNGVEKNTQVVIDYNQVEPYLFSFVGSKELNMTDFNIDPPSPAMGLIKVRDNITIHFNLLVEAGLVTRK